MRTTTSRTPAARSSLAVILSRGAVHGKVRACGRTGSGGLGVGREGLQQLLSDCRLTVASGNKTGMSTKALLQIFDRRGHGLAASGVLS